MALRKIFRKGCTSIENCHVAHDFYNLTITSKGSCIPMLSAGHRYENVRCGCATAFTEQIQKRSRFGLLMLSRQSKRTVSYWVANTVLLDETNTIKSEERCGINSHRIKNVFLFFLIVVILSGKNTYTFSKCRTDADAVQRIGGK